MSCIRGEDESALSHLINDALVYFVWPNVLDLVVPFIRIPREDVLQSFARFANKFVLRHGRIVCINYAPMIKLFTRSKKQPALFRIHEQIRVRNVGDLWKAVIDLEV